MTWLHYLCSDYILSTENSKLHFYVLAGQNLCCTGSLTAHTKKYGEPCLSSLSVVHMKEQLLYSPTICRYGLVLIGCELKKTLKSPLSMQS